MRTLTAPKNVVLQVVDYASSAVLFFAVQMTAEMFSFQDSSGRVGVREKRDMFFVAHTEMLKHQQVSVSGPLADEFRMYLSEKTARTREAQAESAQVRISAKLPAHSETPARFVAYEVRPVLETEGNDESKDVQSFLTFSEARAAFLLAVHTSADDLEDDQIEMAAEDNGIRLFWTLYGVNPDGTSDAITDTETEAQAFEMLAKITGIAGVSGTVRYAVPAPKPQRPQVSAVSDRRLFDDGRGMSATDGVSYAPATTETASVSVSIGGRDALERLEYLRRELRAERISYGELTELQSLAGFIAPDDVELLEAAGVPEHPAPAQVATDHTGEMDAAGYPAGQDGELSPADAEREYYQRNPHHVPGR